MPEFGARSLRNLATVHMDLQRVCNEAIRHYDFSVLCGHRNREKQNEAVMLGRSRAPWPTSKHNNYPSLAVDLAPWHADEPHIRWDDLPSFYLLATYILVAANELGVRVIWGGHWRGFRDLPHFQLAAP
jgi:peptidoglycan LD-endopeptidase CwlK